MTQRPAVQKYKRKGCVIMEAKVFQEHLEKNLIPFWSKMKDEENGGFYGYADFEGKPDIKVQKVLFLTAGFYGFFHPHTSYFIKKSC